MQCTTSGMNATVRLVENRSVVREKLGGLALAAIRVLSGVARRLGSPALASVPVSAAALTRVDTVNSEQPLEDVARLLVGNRQSQVPIVDGGQLIGVVTRADFAVAVEVFGPHAPVAEAHRHNVVTVSPSDSLADVLDRLRVAPDSIAVVVDHGELVGLLTFERLLAYARIAAHAAV